MLQEHTYTHACVFREGKANIKREKKKERRDPFHSIHLRYTPSLLQRSAGDHLSIVEKENVFQNRFPIGKHSKERGKMLPLDKLGTKIAALIDPLAQNKWARFSKGKHKFLDWNLPRGKWHKTSHSHLLSVNLDYQTPREFKWATEKYPLFFFNQWRKTVSSSTMSN